MKAIRQAQTRDILDAYNREDISYSRMNEMFNELADEFAIGFADWVNGEAEYLDYNEKGTVYLYKHNRYRTSELLEIYKKKGL
jgi:hypothetical protein